MRIVAGCRARTNANTAVVASSKKVDIKKQGLASVKDKIVQANLMGVSEKMNKKGWTDSQGRKGKVSMLLLRISCVSWAGWVLGPRLHTALWEWVGGLLLSCRLRTSVWGLDRNGWVSCRLCCLVVDPCQWTYWPRLCGCSKHLMSGCMAPPGHCQRRLACVLQSRLAVLQGFGVYRFAKKYGANVDGYSPIYTPDSWSESGDQYSLGTKGLIAW